MKLSTGQVFFDTFGLWCSGDGHKAPFFMFITKAKLQELTELMEDTVSYYCDENMMSGEKVWTILNCLSQAKLTELEIERTNWMDALTDRLLDNLYHAVETMTDRAVAYGQSPDANEVEIAKAIVEEWTEPVYGDCLLTHHLMDNFEVCKQVIIFGRFDVLDDHETHFSYGDLTFTGEVDDLQTGPDPITGLWFVVLLVGRQESSNMARKTVDVKALVEWTNERLRSELLEPEHKLGLAILLDHVLHESGQYCGFGYTESYDPENWDDSKEYSRQYYFKNKW